MYYTGIDPFNGKPLFVEKELPKKEFQKEIVTGKNAAPVRRRRGS